MENKKVLIISSHFYPINNPRSFRTTELAKEFARQGHDVTVLTPKKEEHKEFEKEHDLRIKDLGQPKWKSIEIKGKGIKLLIRRAARRFSILLFEYPGIELMWMVEKVLKKEREKYDILISIAVPYPIHWGVAKVWDNEQESNSAKVWIADCGDPYMGQENDTFTPPFYFGWVEKWLMRKADVITVPVKTAISAYYPEFHEKIKVIPQGFRFEDVEVQNKKKPNPVPTFAYAGGLIPGRRDPKELLQYLSSLNKEFKFILYTKSDHLVTPYIDSTDSRFEIRDYIPRSELLHVLSGMDFVVNFENVGSRQIPSKLIDYAIIDKPILSIETGNLNTEAVDQFLQGIYTQQLQIEDPDKYRIENVVRKFLDVANKKFQTKVDLNN